MALPEVVSSEEWLKAKLARWPWLSDRDAGSLTPSRPLRPSWARRGTQRPHTQGTFPNTGPRRGDYACLRAYSVVRHRRVAASN